MMGQPGGPGMGVVILQVEPLRASERPEWEVTTSWMQRAGTPFGWSVLPY
jgi:hypothetical protein